MDGDKKDVLPRLEDGNLESMPDEGSRTRRSVLSRHLKAFGISVIGLLLFVMLTHQGSHIGRDVSELSTHSNEPGFPNPSDGVVVRCIGGEEWDAYYDSPTWDQQYSLGSESFFSLPVDSEALSLVSRGIFHFGTVTVEQSTDVSDSVSIRVRAAYYTQEAIDRANVCHIERGENENAIGIFTPTRRLPRQDIKDQIRFDVVLTLPAGVDEDVLFVKKLVTIAPNFLHKITDLADTVFFGEISFGTANFPIDVESVAVETGKFANINGAIKGRFRSTSSLKLTTANMVIDADVELSGGEGPIPSELVMTTVNAPIDARVSLTTASGSGGEFNVNAKTVNSPLTLTYVDSPLDSKLISKASTLHSPATVHLHSAFEGSFSVKSSIIGPSLQKRSVEDPSGEGRERRITSYKRGGLIQGSVLWVGEHSGSGTGSVEVSTELSPAKLTL